MSEADQSIIRNGTRPSLKGPDTYFTGSVRIDNLFQASAPGRATGAIVTFEPSARTYWRSHPAGQTLVILTGVGWTQCERGPRTEIRAGDVVSCGCGKRHWHGAAATTAMSHFAITEAIDGRNTDWMEPVSDSQYLGGLLGTD